MVEFSFALNITHRRSSVSDFITERANRSPGTIHTRWLDHPIVPLPGMFDGRFRALVQHGSIKNGNRSPRESEEPLVFEIL